MSLDDRTAASVPIDLVGTIESGATPDIDQLVRAYYADVFRFARSMLNHDGDAEDAAQETFIAAARALDGFRGESKIKTWLFGITLNICRSQVRKRKRTEKLQQALQAVIRIQPRPRSPEEQAVRSETGERLRKALDALDEKHRIPVVLFYIHDFPVPEIARMLKTRPGTIYSRLHYARKQLHGLIRDG